ncbi:MAG: SDR family oxidoreductase [Tepidiformaceae bacterium]
MTVTLITGCSSGVGRACAVHFARSGHRVYASMREPGPDAAELMAAHAGTAVELQVLRLDVDLRASVSEAVAQVLEREGRVDLVINCAGVTADGPVEEAGEGLFRQAMETNFFGPLRVIQAVLPGMRERGSGAIVNISAISGRMTFGGRGAYAASKYALEAMTEALALETAEFGVRVILIEPGFLATPFFSKSASPPGPYSPYAPQGTRHLRVLMRLLEEASPPETVARAIEAALASGEQRLRYVVGDDAEMLFAGRSCMTDEEWLAAGREMTLEQEEEFWREKFGFEL